MDNFPQQIASQVDETPPAHGTNPFYIISPPYSLESAHSRILFLLCHYLNTLGENAFIFPYPLDLKSDRNWPYFCRFPVGDWQNSRLNVKMLTQDVADEHFKTGLTPICIVPEIFDDPIHAPFIARYITDEPGKISEKYTTPQHFTFCYNERLAEYAGSEVVLNIPLTETSNSEILEPIRSLVSAMKQGIRAITYERQIDLPYSPKLVFIDSDDKPGDNKWRRRPIKLREREPPEEPQPRSVGPKSLARLFVLNWLLPPKVSQLFVAIRNVVSSRD